MHIANVSNHAPVRSAQARNSRPAEGPADSFQPGQATFQLPRPDLASRVKDTGKLAARMLVGTLGGAAAGALTGAAAIGGLVGAALGLQSTVAGEGGGKMAVLGAAGVIGGAFVQAVTGATVPLAIAGAIAGGIAGGAAAVFGAESSYLDDSVRQSLGATFAGDAQGHFHVASVAPDGLAAAAGLQAGDVIALKGRNGATSAQLTDHLVENLSDSCKYHHDFARELPVERNGQALTLTFPELLPPPV